jgi:uroporphyrin-III C-methyltransferase/precorrin-2 dehydrogenase/sirohydrochlorin ferrochelatase
MGLGSLPNLSAKLIEHGLPPTWPAALVEEGTSPKQRVVTGTLADLASTVAAAGIKGASLVIVGEVVRLRERLHWFGASQ